MVGDGEKGVARSGSRNIAAASAGRAAREGFSIILASK